MTDRLQQLSDQGVSVWLDDISRERLKTGNLEDLIKNRHVVGARVVGELDGGATCAGGGACRWATCGVHIAPSQ